MIEPGIDLLHYRLIEKVGEGGMGVVWKAQDTTLNREAAIKILPQSFAADTDRRARFEREARLLAALNHPNIAGVYGLHEAGTPDGPVHFIAMELVPGEDLSERLARGPLSVDDAIDVARQVADALETAHEQGVIHRDLKPANIKRTPEGQIKVLDLGLAKALATDNTSDPGSLSLSPTVTSAGTIAGTLLGTAAYMSPEQVKGKEADRRADIWAYGCVLHEMLTGTCIFAGETISETLAAVLRDDVAQDALPAETPASVRHLLKRCLDRDRRTRLRDIGEARVALSPEGLANPAGGSFSAGGPAVAPRGARLPWAIAALALMALPLAVWFALGSGESAPRPEVRAYIGAPEEHLFEATSNYAGALSISPDGMKMTFSASTGKSPAMLFLRAIGSVAAQQIPGTEGATYPFWSADSRELAFFVDGKLKKLNLDGGAPMTIAVAGDGRGGTWNPDGTILFAPDTQSGIARVSSGGVLGKPVTQLDSTRGGESTHRFPFFLPDGRHFLYVRGSHGASSQDAVNSIWIGDTDSEETVELMQSSTQSIYAQGHLFWGRESFLMARPFSPEQFAFTGEAFSVGQDVIMETDTWRGAFSVSEAGPLTFQSGLSPETSLTWFDREGTALGIIGEPGKFSFIRFSPDNRSLAVTLKDDVSGQGDIWVYDLSRNVGSRLTFDDSNDESPVWSPDGNQIAFSSNRGDKRGIYLRAANGRGAAELLFDGQDGQARAEDWSLDGQFLAFNNGIGKLDLWILPLDGTDAYPLIAGPFDEGYARFSPDSNWLIYITNETGRYELYMTRFPSGEGKWQLSRDGADWAVGWNAAGNEFFYMNLEGRFCAVKVELGDNVVADEPNCLFPAQANRSWTNASDGERFILGVPNNKGTNFPITLVLNWEGVQ